MQLFTIAVYDNRACVTTKLSQRKQIHLKGKMLFFEEDSSVMQVSSVAYINYDYIFQIRSITANIDFIYILSSFLLSFFFLLAKQKYNFSNA